MKHEIHPPIDFERFADILETKFEIRIAAQVFDISFGPCQQIVQNDNFKPLRQQTIAHVRSDETRSSGYHCAFFSQVRHNFECSTQRAQYAVDNVV